MSKFKVGDRVLAVDNIGAHKTPAPGTITKLYRPVPIEGVYDYQVKYDDQPRSSLWSNVTGLLREKHPVIVITTDGKTTTATKRIGKKVLATATARCNPDDKFHFDTGAALAVARLVGAEVKFTEAEVEEEKPSYYNGKVVCVKSIAPWWTAGKIYTFQDGRVEDDYGGIGVHHFKSLEEFNDSAPNARRFIPLVED